MARSGGSCTSVPLVCDAFGTSMHRPDCEPTISLVPPGMLGEVLADGDTGRWGLEAARLRTPTGGGHGLVQVMPLGGVLAPVAVNPNVVVAFAPRAPL